jgi:hypothetical protein
MLTTAFLSTRHEFLVGMDHCLGEDGWYLGGGRGLAAVLLLDDHLMGLAFGLEGIGRKMLHAQRVLE